jgi:hypothetical protein
MVEYSYGTDESNGATFIMKEVQQDLSPEEQLSNLEPVLEDIGEGDFPEREPDPTVGLRFAPLVTPAIEYENASNVDVISDNCGRTQSRKSGDRNWDITVESDWGLRNEIKALMQFQSSEVAEPLVITDLYKGRIQIQDITINQGVNQNVARIAELPTQGTAEFTGDEVRVYSYQIQLKQPSEDEGLIDG